MLRQIQRPWLKRYLKRSETLAEIAACDNLLRDALSLFSVSMRHHAVSVNFVYILREGFDPDTNSEASAGG